MDLITQVQEKVSALKVPRGFATIPVLFHIAGVSSNLATDDYFYRIIDIADFLLKSSLVKALLTPPLVGKLASISSLTFRYRL